MKTKDQFVKADYLKIKDADYYEFLDRMDITDHGNVEIKEPNDSTGVKKHFHYSQFTFNSIEYDLCVSSGLIMSKDGVNCRVELPTGDDLLVFRTILKSTPPVSKTYECGIVSSDGLDGLDSFAMTLQFNVGLSANQFLKKDFIYESLLRITSAHIYVRRSRLKWWHPLSIPFTFASLDIELGYTWPPIHDAKDSR